MGGLYIKSPRISPKVENRVLDLPTNSPGDRRENGSRDLSEAEGSGESQILLEPIDPGKVEDMIFERQKVLSMIPMSW